jgi:hypothetical protein
MIEAKEKIYFFCYNIQIYCDVGLKTTLWQLIL